MIFEDPPRVSDLDSMLMLFRYLFSYLDRSALANASIFGESAAGHLGAIETVSDRAPGFRQSLGINVTQYNLITTVSGTWFIWDLLRSHGR